MTKNFKHHVRITLDEELSKHDVSGILSTVGKSLTDVFESSEEGTAVIYHTDEKLKTKNEENPGPCDFYRRF